jgi:hypothetical protein
MSLHLLRDFAEAYANYVGVGGRGAGGPEAAIELAELAATLLGGGNGYTETADFQSLGVVMGVLCELEAFRTAQSMLLDGDLAAEDKPMVERLLTNAAIRFARKLALLPPTEKA